MRLSDLEPFTVAVSADPFPEVACMEETEIFSVAWTEGLRVMREEEIWRGVVDAREGGEI